MERDLRSQHYEPGGQKNLHKEMAHKIGKFECVEGNKENMLDCVSEGLAERMGRICKAGQGPRSAQ